MGYVLNADSSLTVGFAAIGDTDLSDAVDLTDLLAAGTYGQGSSLPKTFKTLAAPDQNATDLAGALPLGEVSMVVAVPEPGTGSL